MPREEFLKINPRKVMRSLGGIVSQVELDKIEEELKSHVRSLVRLGDAHLRFAKASRGNCSWRQRVSRSYYACYSLSKAIRYAKTGVYTTDSSDHKKIGDLPDDFCNKNVWENKLTQFRADRNIADYDHAAKESALEVSSNNYVDDAVEFVREVKKYLRGNSFI